MSDDPARKIKSEPPGRSLDGQGLSGGLKLAGSGSGAAVGGGGIRSPLAAGASLPPIGSAAASASAGQAPAGSNGLKPAANKAAANAPSQASKESNGSANASMRELSQIKGFSQVSHQLPGETSATHVSHVMYDPTPARAKKAVLVLLLLAAVASGYALYQNPGHRRLITKQLTELKDDVLILLDPNRKKPKPRAKVRVAVGRDPNAPVTRPSAGRRRSCQQLMLAASGGASMSVAQRVDAAECHLVQGDLVSAEAVLKPIQTRIQRASEAELNRVAADRTIADAHQVLLTTLIKEGKSQEASRLVAGMCLRWQQTNSCVAKVMMLADRHLNAPGVDAMFGTQSKLAKKAQSRLWLAGAQLASAGGRASTADRRYALALQVAPKQAMALRKGIFEVQAVDLFRRGAVRPLQSLVGRATKELKPLGPEGKVKLDILLDLATAPDRGRFTKQLLTREEMTFRVRRDIDLIELAGPESLRHGLEDDYLRLLRRAREFYNDKYRATDGIERRIMAWEIRAMISSGDAERALVLTHTYERTYGSDVFVHHLRGIAYHLASAHDRYQALAAQEFQAALRKSRNWESLYALGVTLTRSGKKELVAQVIKDLDRMTTTKGQRFWSDMLKGEWYLAQGKVANAEKVLAGWVRTKPTAYTPRRLLQKTYEAASRRADAQRTEKGLAGLAARQRFRGSTEAFASPLGPMALGVRAIE